MKEGGAVNEEDVHRQKLQASPIFRVTGFGFGAVITPGSTSISTRVGYCFAVAVIVRQWLI